MKLRSAGYGALSFLCVLLIVGSGDVACQNWPDKPIRMIVPFPAGGGTDLVGRYVANRLAEALGQPVVVDNRGGAGGTIGSDIVAKATPDGYTFGIATSSTHPVAGLVQKIPYDPVQSFSAVTLVGITPYVIVASPGLPPNTLSEFIGYLKDNPGKVNVAHVGTTTLGYLITEAFKMQTATDMLAVPFKGSAQVYPDLIGNRVQVFFDNPVASAPLIKAGRLKAFAVSLPTPLLPTTPTMEQAGMKGFNHGFWYGVVAPAGTPRAIVGRAQRELAKAVNSPAGKSELNALAVDAVGSTPEQFAATIKSDIEIWGKVARSLGLKPE